MGLKGKSVLITGAAKRVGRTIALRLAEEGMRLFLHYNRSRKEMDATIREIHERFEVRVDAYGADLADPEAVNKMMHLIHDAVPHVDVFISNAAIFYKTPFEHWNEVDFDKYININLKAPYLLSHLIGQKMKAGQGGKMIFLGDWCALRPYNNYIPYAISKAGLIPLMKGLAKTLAPEVKVNLIAPGTVIPPEEMDDAEREKVLSKIPLKTFGTPGDITETVIYLLKQTDFVTGSILTVDGGRSL